MLFLYNGGPIAWCSRRQKNVTTSTAESEYVAASETAKESSWIANILPDLVPEWKGPVPLRCDNQAAIGSAEHLNQGKKMKHVRLKYHHIRELIEEKEITIEYVRSEEQLADIFTKAYLDLVSIIFEKQWVLLTYLHYSNSHSYLSCRSASRLRRSVRAYSREHYLATLQP